MLRLTVDVRKASDAGIGTYIRNVVPRVLERLGTAVQVVALVPHGRAGQYDWLNHVPGVRLLPTRASPMTLADQLELPRVVSPESLFWATSLAHPLWRRTPLVTTLHDVAQLALGPVHGVSVRVAWAARLLLSSQRSRATALMAVSEFTRDEFLQRLGVPKRGRIDVIPLGVDAKWHGAARDAYHRPPRPYFICVGSVRPHKNIAGLLRAFAFVEGQLPHDLVIAGLNPRNGEHLAWLASMPEGLRRRVRFTGLMEEAALRDAVAGADALVFPSLYEGFGLPALEAMAANCPVLASTAGALPEVCSDAAAGYFDPHSAESIGSALTQFAALPSERRRRIVAAGRARAHSFTWDRTADLTAHVVETALRSNTRVQ